jgi:hypothetical protein
MLSGRATKKFRNSRQLKAYSPQEGFGGTYMRVIWKKVILILYF